MKKNIYTLIALGLLVSCTESLEDKAVREAKEYTKKVCPTPYVNDGRTDSASFDKSTRTYTYYMSLQSLDNNPGLKKYKEAHFSFRFIYHSAKNPKEVLLDDTFKY